MNSAHSAPPFEHILPSFTNPYEIIETTEEEVFKAINYALNLCKTRKQNTNIIPQFVGHNPISVAAGAGTYDTIIIRQKSR